MRLLGIPFGSSTGFLGASRTAEHDTWFETIFSQVMGLFHWEIVRMRDKIWLFCTLAVGSGFAQNVDFASYIPWRQTDNQPGVHDPTVIRDERGVYTLMSTNNLLAISQSTDRLTSTSKARPRPICELPSWIVVRVHRHREHLGTAPLEDG